MKTETIIEKIKSIPGGRFFRVRYISKVKMAADALKEGITIFKIVDTTTRTGVKYKNIEGVTLSENYTPKETNWEWVVKDRIKHNTKTGKDYLVVAPINKGAHVNATYIMTDNEGNTSVVDKETVKKYAIKSYFSEDKKPATIQNITLENVLMVK